MAKKKKHSYGNGTIAVNRKARHEYHIEDKFEAGMVLAGWEVKSMRDGKCQITDAYVQVKNEEVWLLGVHIQPLQSACTHVIAEPDRTRKLLLNKREISKLIGKINQTSRSCVPLAIYWLGNKVKCEIALVQGKTDYDKRSSEKDKDWSREKQRVVRHDTTF